MGFGILISGFWSFFLFFVWLVSFGISYVFGLNGIPYVLGLIWPIWDFFGFELLIGSWLLGDGDWVGWWWWLVGLMMEANCLMMVAGWIDNGGWSYRWWLGGLMMGVDWSLMVARCWWFWVVLGWVYERVERSVKEIIKNVKEWIFYWINV